MRLPVPRNISLANKCLLLFGGAVVLIVVAALTAPWLRMNHLVAERELDVARRMVDVWQRLEARGVDGEGVRLARGGEAVEHAGIRVRPVPLEEIEAGGDPFLNRAARQLRENGGRVDAMQSGWEGVTRVYRYVRAVRAPGEPVEDALRGLLVLERRSDDTAVLLIVNTVYLLSAGLLVLALALLVFYFITHRLILAPVRSLKATAEKVREGDIATRSAIQTGDEFEQLAETFNRMLAALQASQEHQRAVNRALDVKLNELAEANTALHESNRLKGEFLANVSHELRTPLNSIIGFAELLMEIARQEETQQGATPQLSKRSRYQANIANAGRNLLEMIESLLEMAKIEAGRIDIRVEQVSPRELAEALLALIQPLADAKGIDLSLEAEGDVPLIRTDSKKLHQILFNFLSNAVKFVEPAERTGRRGQITMRIERLPARRESEVESVRFSVIDNGPGIPPEEQARVFEKFHQLDAGHTRQAGGTGLGLAICRELAILLQGEIQLVSEVGRGSMFSLIIPLEIDESREREGRLERHFRGSLATGRRWSDAAEGDAGEAAADKGKLSAAGDGAAGDGESPPGGDGAHEVADSRR